MAIVRSSPSSADDRKRMIAGIDIGGTKIAVGLVGAGGIVITRTETPIQVERGFAAAMDRVSELLKTQLESHEAELQGIGIGCTGPVEPFSGELGDVNTLPGWQGSSPVAVLSTRFDVSAAMENDADAAALGEVAWGSGKGLNTMICITVGTGIGSGVILNGEIYRGAGESHPELGHHILDASGPVCTCGARGCWEAFASGPAIEHWMAMHAPPLQQGFASAKEICELARQGDALAQRAVAHTGRYLAMGLANIVTLFMPQAIVLGGSVMQSADLFLGTVRATIRQNCCLVPYEKCEIKLCSLGTDVGILGAAEVWNHRFHHREINRES